MSIEMVVFCVEGMSPLLMHSASAMRSNSGDEVKGKTVVLPPDEEAKAGVYALDNGDYYMPAIAFRNSLLAAGTGKRIGKMSAIRCLAAGVFSAEVSCPLFHPKTKKPIREHKVLLSRVVLKSGGRPVAVLRARPLIDNWACKVALEIDTDFVAVKHLVELFGLAGRMIGVGDWRPEKKGPYGRYSVNLIE